jgi:hypothetical protein
MPNHVQNILFVEGSPDETSAFFYSCRVSDEKPFSFAGIVPRPTDAQLGRKLVMGMGYALGLGPGFAHPMAWEIEHWGSKWDAYEVGTTIWAHPQYKRIVFQTAWTAPVPWLVAASKRFPALVFRILSKDEGELHGSILRVWDGGETEVDKGAGHDDGDDDDDDGDAVPNSVGDISRHFDAGRPHRFLRYMNCYNFVDGPLVGEMRSTHQAPPPEAAGSTLAEALEESRLLRLQLAASNAVLVANGLSVPSCLGDGGGDGGGDRGGGAAM